MNLVRTPLLLLVVGVIFLSAASNVPAAAIWSNTNSGLWRINTNWAGGNPPRLSLGSTYITNAGTKTVTVDAETPATNLIINALNIWAPPAFTNTLLLQDVGTNTPLVISNQSLTIANRGALRVTNSSLVVTGNFINFNVWAGELTLDSGLILAREEPPTENITVITRIGRTNTATLTINGGEMRVTQMLLGDTPGPVFGRSRGTVQMNGGLLTVFGQLSVGDGIGCTGLVQMVGGEIHALDQGTNVNRIGDLGRGEMTISNAVFNVGNLSVGRHDGSFGILTLQENGFYFGSDDLNIARFGGATGLVHLAGGTLTVASNQVWVGREGSGQLIVSNGVLITEGVRVSGESTNTSTGVLKLGGGISILSSNLLVGDGIFTNGSVVMSAGALFITNSAGVANLELQSGLMSLSGGTATVDRIIITNSLAAFRFQGGTLRSKETTVTNGAPFTVGDGVTPAQFILEGGTHSFANGLVISPNAVVTGCGTIVGSIVNNGTLSVSNCSSAGAAPAISQQPVSMTVTQGATASFSVVATGDAPLRYQWWRGTPGLDATDVSGATSALFAISNAQGADAGPYHVIITNLFGSVTSAVAVLRVLVPTQIQDLTRVDSAFNFTFLTLTNLNYTVEFKDTLDALQWTPIETLPGTGGFLSVTNFTTNSPTRFFRLRIE